MNFDQAFDRLIGHEGGYSNHPDDPGGETMWGVTIAVARANGYAGPMRSLPRDVAKAIYRAHYWDEVKADSLPFPVAFQVFDAAVNHGTGQAAKRL
ncbi:glycosyl hydrolase 108 family protein [Achromobacter aegrifaciens]